MRSRRVEAQVPSLIDGRKQNSPLGSRCAPSSGECARARVQTLHNIRTLSLVSSALHSPSNLMLKLNYKKNSRRQFFANRNFNEAAFCGDGLFAHARGAAARATRAVLRVTSDDSRSAPRRVFVYERFFHGFWLRAAGETRERVSTLTVCRQSLPQGWSQRARATRSPAAEKRERPRVVEKATAATCLGDCIRVGGRRRFQRPPATTIMRGASGGVDRAARLLSVDPLCGGAPSIKVGEARRLLNLPRLQAAQIRSARAYADEIFNERRCVGCSRSTPTAQLLLFIVAAAAAAAAMAAAAATADSNCTLSPRLP